MNDNSDIRFTRRFVVDAQKKGTIYIKERTAGYVFNGVNSQFVENVTLTLISESVADKVLLNLSGSEMLELFENYVNSSRAGSSDQLGDLGQTSDSILFFVVPFAVGDLQLDDNDYLRLDIQFVSSFDVQISGITYDRILLGYDAKNPIFVKKQTSVLGFDSENFDKVVLSKATAITYFKNGQKVFLPVGFLQTTAALNRQSINFKPIRNLTYDFKDAVDVMLIEF
ncbi:hypothetical protein [Soonwooa purpurea]